jgi:parallel beta-helix repeat protein
MPESPAPSADRRALLAGIGGLAAGTLMVSGRAQAGPLTPPLPPAPTGKPLTHIEPRIAITPENIAGDATGLFVITQPGSYYLVGNVTGESGKSGIVIGSHHVTLDLMGFHVMGVTGALNGIRVSGFRYGVVIRNGSVSGWPQSGITASIDSGLIENIHATNNGQWGITQNGGYSARLIGCSAYGNGLGGADFGGIRVGECVLVDSCQARENMGSGIKADRACLITNCVAVENSGTGIDVVRECVVTANSSTGNTMNGIRATEDSNQIERNHCVSNTTGIRLDGSMNAVRDNIVRANTFNYIFAAGNQLDLLLSEVPQILSWPCHARLAGSLTGVASQNGITIESDGVTIDLGGHELVGVPGSLTGIIQSGGRSNLAVCNGTVRGWGGGINLSSGDVGSRFRVEDVTVTGCGQTAIRVGDDARVARCTVADSSGLGIWSGRGIVDSCNVSNVVDNGIIGLNRLLVTNCTVSGVSGEFAVGIYVGAHSIVRNCTATGNSNTGIFAVEWCIVEGCLASDNIIGIQVSIDCIVQRNNCTYNRGPEGVGILVNSESCRVEENHCSGNTVGIKSDPTYGINNFIARNTCMRNTTDFNIAAGNVCLVVAAATGGAINGSSGGVSPGSTNPNANYTH